MQQLKLGYPYSYGDELTPEMARSNRNKIKTISLLILLLKVSKVQADPFPGADGFTPTYICRQKQTYSYSIEATSLSTRLKSNRINENRPQSTKISQYIPEFDSIIDNKQIQRKYKHAPDFRILGNFNQKNAELFKDKIIEHMKKSSTQIIEGRYRKREVTHYFNPETKLNIFFTRDNNEFISSWLLKADQVKNMLNRGAF